jgi:hypothetical protein
MPFAKGRFTRGRSHFHTKVTFASAILLALCPAIALGQNFVTVDVPGATQTFGRSVNPQGDMVGFYTVPPGVHGFTPCERL